MKKYLPFLLLFVAIAVSTSAAFYSVYGLSKLFSGASIPVIIMASSLEIAKLVIAGTLHLYWSQLSKLLKYYLSFAILVLAIITSMGIYGFLSDAFQQTYTKDRYVQTEINVIKKKQQRYQNQLDLNSNEKIQLDKNILELRESLTENAQTQTIKNGQVLTNIIPTSKKSIENQLQYSINRTAKLDSIISNNTDSISNLDLQIIELEKNAETTSELGPLKYVQELTGKPMNIIVNWFLLLLILVFDPLSIALVVTALFAFKQVRIDSSTNTTNHTNISPEPESEPNTNIDLILVKPKRKYTRRQKTDTPVTNGNELNEPISVPDANLLESEPIIVDVPVQKKRRSKRKVVESGLTPNIALHMSESISKKKVKKD